jgi:hypothetical protein
MSGRLIGLLSHVGTAKVFDGIAVMTQFPTGVSGMWRCLLAPNFYRPLPPISQLPLDVFLGIRGSRTAVEKLLL